MAKNEKKRPFELRLADDIFKYEAKFSEHPPIFGYKDDELYQLLLNSLEHDVEMIRIDEKIRDVNDLDDDELIYT